jgi:hypothetical protein
MRSISASELPSTYHQIIARRPTRYVSPERKNENPSNDAGSFFVSLIVLFVGSNVGAQMSADPRRAWRNHRLVARR